MLLKGQLPQYDAKTNSAENEGESVSDLNIKKEPIVEEKDLSVSFLTLSDAVSFLTLSDGTPLSPYVRAPGGSKKKRSLCN